MKAIKLTQEQVEFLECNSNVIINGDDKWYHIPHWFKQESDFSFSVVGYDKLPATVVKITSSHKRLEGECTGNNDNGCFLDSPGHDCGCFKKV